MEDYGKETSNPKVVCVSPHMLISLISCIQQDTDPSGECLRGTTVGG